MKNRKFIVIAFAVLLMTAMLSMSACNRNQEPAVQPTQPVLAPTEAPEIPAETPTEPAPMEPAWVAGKAKANYVEAVYETLERGTEVTVTGKFAHYFVISAEPYDLLVDERCIRLETEDAFESYVAYSRYDKPVFDSVYMRTAPIARLTTNVKLTVLEAKDNWVLVEWADGKGYMMAEDISKSWIAPKSSGSGSSGSGGSAPADGTDVDVNSLSATEQQNELALLGSYHGPKMEEVASKGIVIADKTEAYITLFGFGEDIKVVASDEKSCSIYLGNGVTVQVPRHLVRLESDPVDDIFTGFSASGAVVFKDYQGRTEHTQLKFNNEVQVLYKLPALSYEGEEIYVVVVDGETMYMHVRTISQTRRQAPSGKASESNAPVDVWTPPML